MTSTASARFWLWMNCWRERAAISLIFHIARCSQCTQHSLRCSAELRSSPRHLQGEEKYVLTTTASSYIKTPCRIVRHKISHGCANPRSRVLRRQSPIAFCRFGGLRATWHKQGKLPGRDHGRECRDSARPKHEESHDYGNQTEQQGRQYVEKAFVWIGDLLARSARGPAGQRTSHNCDRRGQSRRPHGRCCSPCPGNDHQYRHEFDAYSDDKFRGAVSVRSAARWSLHPDCHCDR